MYRSLAPIIGVTAFAVSVGLINEVTAQTCTPPRPDVVSWWDADATSGITARDLKGKNPGSMIGGVKVVPDPRSPGPRKFERTFHLDGSGFIDMRNPAELQFGASPFSLEAWFASERGEAEYPYIISKSNSPVSGPGAGYWIRLLPTTQTVEFFAGETVGIPKFPSARVTTAVSLGVWHHVVGTRDPAGSMKLYVDGRIAGSGNIDPTFSVDADTPFTVGAWNERFGIRNYAFSGYLADISVYNRALSVNEVHALFSAPKCRVPAR